ncbi:MAG TPA: tetratricopeptide repeat protein [Methylomirabilota bacterium]|jgi:tetratricopeptide (TPR) repeat protein
MLTSIDRVALRGAVAVALLTLGLSGIAGADGGGGGGQGAIGAPTRAEDPQYTAAVKAIKAGEYAKAIPLLEGVTARDGKNADAYNWLGYATRKNGNPSASIPIYQKALAIDPKHKGAHEYIGEAYLMLGDLPKAKEHLKTLDSLCFITCEEYRDLKRAVEAYEKSGGAKKPTASQ